MTTADDYDYSRDAEYGPVPDAEDVLRGPLDVLDPTRPPPPRLCRDCGAELPWVWWPGRGRISARWTFPQPCQRCEFDRVRNEASLEIERRQEASGIPARHRRHRWAWSVLQDVDETWATFARRVKAKEKASTPQIGIARRDAPTAKELRLWEPRHGSLYLHGPVGSGKSLWCAARVTDLLAPTDEGEVELSEGELVERGVPESMAAVYVRHGRNRFRRPGGLQVHRIAMLDEEEIVRRVTLAWKGDPAPLVGIARADVLVYDDLGTVLVGSPGAASELAARCIAQLVDLRWREERPMLVTSNRPIDDLREHLDARTVDRLHEMVGERQHAMVGVPVAYVERGYSWRRLPPDAPEDTAPSRPPPQAHDRQRAAAGEDW